MNTRPKPQARFLDIAFGLHLMPPPFMPCTGIVIIGSQNTFCNALPVARLIDTVMSTRRGIGIIVTGSKTVYTNQLNNARSADYFIGGYIGIIVTGSPNKFTDIN